MLIVDSSGMIVVPLFIIVQSKLLLLMFLCPTKGDDIEKSVRFQHFLETSLIPKMWVNRFTLNTYCEDIVGFAGICNYCCEDVCKCFYWLFEGLNHRLESCR